MPMSQLSSEAFDLAQLYQGYLAGLTLATDLGELARVADAALAALLPAHACQICWLDALGEANLPNDLTLARLRESTSVIEVTGHAATLPLRAAGELIGFLRLSPPAMSTEQELSLSLIAAVLGPSYLALRHAPPTPLERRKAELRLALDRLRGAVAVEPLLREISSLVQAALPFANVSCMLRYRDSEWIALAYLIVGDYHGPVRMYWREDAGLSSIVIKSGKSLYTDSYQDECARWGIAPLSDISPLPIQAWMGVPMHDNGTVFGAIVSFSNIARQNLADDDRTLLSWLAEEVSRLIHSAQRYERAAEEARRREALIRFARAITSSLDPEYVPTLIVERAPDLFNAEEGSLLLLDEETGELVFRYAAGPAGHQLLGQRLPPGKGVAGYVASSGRSTIVNDTRDDGRFYRALDGDTGFDTRSILAVPLRGINGVKGVIEVLNQRDDAPFTQDDLDLLEALADHAMIALENARQFASVDQALARRVQDLDRSNDRLHKILRASNALRAERQIDDLLPQIAGIVSQSSGFRSAVIALVRRERVPEPYLQRVAAAGPAANEIERLRIARAPLARLEAILRPEFRRGSLTYLIEHEYDEYVNFWGGPAMVYRQSPAEARPGGWHPGDALFCLLRNSRGELIGILGVDDPEDGMRPSEALVQILEILANQAAAAIENAHLYAEQQLSLNRMLALNGLGRAISTTLRSPQQIYELTARGMQEMSDARWATVFLGGTSEGELSASFHTGAPTANPASATQLAREAIAARRPVSQLPGRDNAGEAMIAIPLRGSRLAMGAICVGYGEGAPTAAELETLILFTSQAATAVESLHLLGEVREGRDQLASIMASTREGMLLVSDEARVAVANGAFASLAATSDWPGAPATPADLADLPMSALIERWQATANFPPGELEQLWNGVIAVADGLEIFVRGQLNGLAPGSRSLEWTVLRATREGAGAHTNGGEPNNGRHQPILLTVRDITAAKETERLRNDLTNMMVHDLRSPLTSIMTSIDMIFRGITGDVTGTQREILTIAYTSAQNLLNMINLLLDISRLEGGRMPLDRTALAVEGLVERAASRMSVIARNKNIAIDVTVSPGAAYVYADSELVLRVLQNLLDNALKFSPRGSTIVLAADTLPAEPAPPPAQAEEAAHSMETLQAVRFAVRDAGVGIKQADLDKIFHKFGQAGNRRNAGSGLGLTFCKLVTEAHGGRIWVESTPGLGSTFYFTMPASGVEEEV
ncbi:MAG: GAF domain-containing protein [Chloroflexales bacterium]|nr:GAF domain-containing protein [Chloroflexales bacterium]